MGSAVKSISILCIVLFGTQLASSGQYSGVLSALYKKASDSNRPLVIVVDNANSLKRESSNQARNYKSNDFNYKADVSSDSDDDQLPLLSQLFQLAKKSQNQQKHRSSSYNNLKSYKQQNYNQQTDQSVNELLSALGSLKPQSKRDKYFYNKNKYGYGKRVKTYSQKYEKQPKVEGPGESVHAILRSLRCGARDACEDKCEEKFKGKKKNECEDVCEQKFECEQPKKDSCEDKDECEIESECGDSEDGCGDETGSTKGVTLDTEQPQGCKRC